MTSPDSLPPAPVKRSPVFLPAPVAVLLGTVLAVLLLFVYRRYSLTFGTGDDHANMMLEGEAFLRGNYLLSHWYLTTVTWYTTDVVLYALGIRLRGMNPVLMHEVPTVVFALLLGMALYLAARNRAAPGGFRWQGAAVAFALIGLPLDSLASHLLLGPWRTVSLLIGLFAFALIGTDERTPVALWRLALLFLATVIVLISDNFPLYVIVTPILMVCAVRAWQLPETRRTEAAIAGAVILGVIAAKLCLRAIPAAGGFTMPDTIAGNIQLVAFDNIGRNFGWTVHTLQVLYGADFWGLPIGVQMIARFLRLISIALIFWAMIHVLRPLTRRVSARTAAALARTDRVELCLALGMVIDLFAYWLTNIAYYLEAQRYMVLFCVFGATLTGRVVARLLNRDAPQGRRVFLLAVACGVMVLPAFLNLAFRPFNDPASRRIAEWLDGQNLHDGYGEYWCGSEVTVRSRGRVRVRVVRPSGSKMEPNLFGTDDRWYLPDVPAYFVLLREGTAGTIKPSEVQAAFGEPSRVVVRDGYIVMIYDRNIAPLLFNRPATSP